MAGASSPLRRGRVCVVFHGFRRDLVDVKANEDGRFNTCFAMWTGCFSEFHRPSDPPVIRNWPARLVEPLINGYRKKHS